ncbi:porin [Rickettsiales bacterium]|nr:porin [Rickettsiales bacterium]
MLILKKELKVNLFLNNNIHFITSFQRGVKSLILGVAIILLFSINSHAQKIRLSKSLILEQKNSFEANYYYKNQNSYFNSLNSNKIDKNNDNINFEADSFIKITKKYSKNNKIGFIGNVKANYGNNSDQNDQYHSYFDKSFLFFQDKFAILQFGRNVPINYKMAISTNNLYQRSSGVNGKYLQYINLPILQNTSNSNISQIGSCAGYNNNGNIISQNGDCSKIKLPKFILLPSSPISHGGYATGYYHDIFDNNYDNLDSRLMGFGANKSNSRINGDNSLGNLQNSLKVNYHIKRINGFKAGIGYTLNAKNDFILDSNDDIKSNLGQIYSWGVNYSNYFENIGLAASITGEYGKADHRQHNLNSYEIGAMVTYFGIAIAGSYGNWGNSLMPKNGIYSCDYNPNLTLANQDCTQNITKFNDAYYLNAGISYEFGPFGTSLTYLKSNFQNNIYQSSAFSLDYKLKKSLKLYSEIVKFDFDSNHAIFFDGSNIINQSSLESSQRQISDNDGYIILTGILFNF